MSNPRMKPLRREEFEEWREANAWEKVWERFGFIGPGRPASGVDPKEQNRLNQQAWRHRQKKLKANK